MVDSLQRLGFGYIVVGSVMCRAGLGNPRRRAHIEQEISSRIFYWKKKRKTCIINAAGIDKLHVDV